MKVPCLPIHVLSSTALSDELIAAANQAYDEGIKQGREEKEYVGNRQVAKLLRDNCRLAGLNQPANIEVRK